MIYDHLNINGKIITSCFGRKDKEICFQLSDGSVLFVRANGAICRYFEVHGRKIETAFYVSGDEGMNLSGVIFVESKLPRRSSAPPIIRPIRDVSRGIQIVGRRILDVFGDEDLISLHLEDEMVLNIWPSLENPEGGLSSVVRYSASVEGWNVDVPLAVLQMEDFGIDPRKKGCEIPDNMIPLNGYIMAIEPNEIDPQILWVQPFPEDS